MSKSIPFNEREMIAVELNGETYNFHHLDEVIADLKPDRLVIFFINKNKRVFKEAWLCTKEVSFEIQSKLEHHLITRVKEYTKSFVLIRVADVDEKSISFTSSDRKSVHCTIMGDMIYAVKPN